MPDQTKIKTKKSCDCAILTTEVSPHPQVLQYEYKQPSPATRSKAAGQSTVPDPTSFPAPLVLPDDDLSWDPEDDEQSFPEWRGARYRNPVTKERNTIYVVPPPIDDTKVVSVSSWTRPVKTRFEIVDELDAQDAGDLFKSRYREIAEYIGAFYNPLPVKILKEPFRFTSWNGTNGRGRTKGTNRPPRYIGMSNTKHVTRIEVREPKDGIYTRQLNLNHLLDSLISMVPDDAYAIVLLIDQDMYEGPDDDFCCGRAYGGSRVCVVSSARYHPLLDKHQKVDRRHAWPASHCLKYVEECCAEEAEPPKKKSRGRKAKPKLPQGSVMKSPLYAAVNTFKETLSAETNEPADKPSDMWLARVCRTVVHELGHCLGIGHCTFYACVMQSTASAAEDLRQPPYLCPVDLAKVLYATEANIEMRYKAIMKLCEKHEKSSLFASYGSWIRARLELIESEVKSAKKEVICISP